MKKFDSFQLKIFMALLMVLDHIDKIPGLIPDNLSLIFHMSTRCVAVWFAYMAVQGFMYTRNQIKYNARLFLWSGIMYLGNNLLEYLYRSKEIIVYNNIVLTLACGVLILNLLFYDIKNSKHWIEDKRLTISLIRILLAIGTFAFALIGTEGGIVVVPFMLVTYLLRNKPKVRNMIYLLFSLVLLFISYVPYNTVDETIKMMMYNCDWLFITVLPFIYLYNGKRGLNNTFSKYFFYVFYPVHIWIIATIAYLLNN